MSGPGTGRSIADALRHAVRTNHIPRVVNLSSIGADRADGLGAISGLHDIEQAVTMLQTPSSTCGLDSSWRTS
jgi:hypothetical protein